MVDELFDISQNCLYCSHGHPCGPYPTDDWGKIRCTLTDEHHHFYDICERYEDNTKGNKNEVLQSEQRTVRQGL